MSEENKVFEVELIPIRQLFYHDASAFGIFAAETDSKKVKPNSYNNITIKGNMQRLELGVKYKAEIEEENDPKYGLGYKVHSIYEDIPQSINEQKDYLKAIITENQVDSIYKVYPDEDIIDLIQKNEFDYTKVHGIGKSTYLRIREKIIESIEFKEMLSELAKYGLKYDVLKKLKDYFGSNEIALQRVKEDPYSLTVVSGIGFKKADMIARNMGFELDHPYRIRSGIRYVLGESQGNGHTYMTISDFLIQSSEILYVESKIIKEQIQYTDGVINLEESGRIALKRAYDCERFIAENLLSRLSQSQELNFDIDGFIIEQEKEMDIQLTKEQKGFFHNFKKYNVNVLVGFAGCGKTALQKLLISLLEKLGYTYRLLSPTAQAAKVMTQYTGKPATTIHRAIGYGRNQEQREDEEDPYKIHEDVIIIDETSMLDVFLCASTLNKIVNPRARIVFVGDSFQIASVAAGNFLHDVIESNSLPTTKLTKVFRQNDDGMLDILTRIREGRHFIASDFIGEKKFGDNVVFRSVEQKWMKDGYKFYYKKLMSKYEPEDIMVLSSTKKGDLGTVEINKEIQELVNPYDSGKDEYEHFDKTYRQDDYVINTVNTYNVESESEEIVDVVNGDMGKIKRIVIVDKDIKSKNKKEDDEPNKSSLIIDFGFDQVKVPIEELARIMHAWSITMHKSQGSASPSVLMIADKSHTFQLNANLLYTAGTRSKETLVILCQAETFNRAMKKFANMSRKTFLCELLKHEKESQN